MTLTTVPRYDSDGPSRWGAHAVVLGAGMAGLFAARVLADGFEAVTVVDRDPLPDETVARRGVPQARHIHVLLKAAQVTLEDVFPGYCDDLVSAGGLEIDAASDVNFYVEGDFLADGLEPIPQYVATRPLYERVVRRRVAGVDGVTLRPRCLFSDYLLDDAATAVEGVVVRNEGAGTEELAADLVVDATGRTSRTPAWLERRGYPAPAVDEVHVDLAYSTVLVERPEDDRTAFVVSPTPDCPRGASVLPVEGDRWLVTLFGLHGDHPPTDPDGLTAFAASLPIPHVERLLDEQARTDTPVAHHPFPSNVRRRYEELDRFPEGLVVVGDAIASFNPIYAQGMSVAALEAVLLHHALSADGRANLAPRFFERAEPVVDVAWTMAVGGDFQFPQTTGPRPRGTALVNRYLARLHRKAHADPALRDAFFRVVMMERPPSSLFHPTVAWRVLKPAG